MSPSEPASSQLFRGSSTDEQNQEDNSVQVRANALQSAQTTQAASDAFSLLTFDRAQTNAESLFNGIGGVPQALSPLYVAPGAGESTGFQIGPFKIRPILSAGIGYGTASGEKDRSSNGFYGTVSPAFTLALGEPATGRVLNVEYTGSLVYGSESAGSEPYNQAISAGGTLNFTRLNLGFGLDFSQLSGSNRDFGGQNVNSEIIGLSLSASYIYSDKTNFSTSLTTPIRLFGKGSDSEGVNGTGFINYVYSPLTTVGIGFGLGTVQVQNSDSQFFEQALARVTYLVTGKLTFSGTVGCEFLGSGSTEQITPVFGLGLAWNIRSGTTLSVDGERSIQNSAANVGTNYTDTSIALTASQRLGDFLQLTATVGYENAEYRGVETGVFSDRLDNTLILQGAVSYHFKSRWVLTGIISYGRDFSNEDSFQSTQTSLQLSYVF